MEKVVVDTEILGEVLYVFGRCFRLTVEESGNGYFITTEFLCDFLECDFLLSLCVEQCFGGGREVGVL